MPISRLAARTSRWEWAGALIISAGWPGELRCACSGLVWNGCSDSGANPDACGGATWWETACSCGWSSNRFFQVSDKGWKGWKARSWTVEGRAERGCQTGTQGGAERL